MMLTCPVCKRSVEALEAVQSRRSMEEGTVIRELTFAFHFERQGGHECRGSRKPVADAEQIAFPGADGK